MFVRQINGLADDKHLSDLGAEFQDVAIGYYQIGQFAGFDAADQFVRAEDLRRVDGQVYESVASLTCITEQD